MKNTVIVKPRINDNLSSYWAMFYCSVLKTICFQKNLKFNFQYGSLESYRGNIRNPANFFNQIRGSINNHGFEYLMIDYLRSKDGIDVAKLLLDRILQKRGVTDFEYNFFNIFKVGEDSKLQAVIDKYDDLDVKIFVPNDNYRSFRNKYEAGFTCGIGSIAKTFINSDLLVLISDGKRYTYGFLGEVEGLHGENLYRENYWSGIKAKYSTFAIGASDRKKIIEQCEIKRNIVISEDLKGREILHFSNANQFVKDFRSVVSNIELCLNGHYSNVSFNDEVHKKIFKFIENGWSIPLNDLVLQFESFIEYVYDPADAYYQHVDEVGDWVFKPSIVASVKEFPFHRFNV